MTDLQEQIAVDISTLTTEKKKLVISFFSNAPWCNTGYGVQVRLNYPRIKALGYELSITAFYGLQGSRMWTADHTCVYPLGKHLYGMDVIGAHAEHAGANVVITLMDAWVVQSENIKMPWYPYFPIDTEPMSFKVFEEVKKATKGIVMSKFGLEQAKAVGLDVYYVPHSVETKVFKPIDRNKARKRLGLPKDKFIVGMVAANKGIPPRKSFYEQIAAFKAFNTVHPDSLLYMHTEDGLIGADMANLVNYCRVMGLKVGYVDCQPLVDDIQVAFVDQYQYTLGIPDVYMVDVYNALDVMILCSLGEGFGIPLIEAQACGCPVITGDWTAMGELVFSGWKIPKSEAFPVFHPVFEAFQWRVMESAVVERLMRAYEMKDNQDYRKRARDGALAYDCDKVAEKYWKPVLADIENRLNEPVVVTE